MRQWGHPLVALNKILQWSPIAQRLMRAFGVVAALPPELSGRERRYRPLALVELLLVCVVGTLHIAVQLRRVGRQYKEPDAPLPTRLLELPTELGLSVHLDSSHRERHPRFYSVEEARSARSGGACACLEHIPSGDDIAGGEALEDHAGQRADIQGIHLDEVAGHAELIVLRLADGIRTGYAPLPAGDARAWGFPQQAAALEELGIRLILAHTPQAKGRVERAWDTFQDRLVSEMRLAGTATIEQANRMLRDFLPRYNRRFGVAPAQPGSAYRQPAPGVSLDAALCFKYLRTVANDNTIHFNGATLQALPDGLRAGYARARVEVQVRLDGSILVFHQGRSVASAPAPLEPVTLRAQKGPRSNGVLPADAPSFSDNGDHDTLTTTPFTPKKTRLQTTTKPSPNHPWRKPLLT